LGVEDPSVNARLLRNRHASLAQLPAHVSNQGGKWSPLAAEPALDTGAQHGRKEWTFARGGDGDQQRITADDRRRDEATLRRSVDDVDEDAGRLGLGPAATVDLQVLAGIDDEAAAGGIARRVFARRYDLNIGSRLTERGCLFDRELAFAKDHAALAREVEEHRVVPHAVASSVAASRSTFATSGRVNSGGRSLPSARSLRTAVPLSVLCSSGGCGQVRDDPIPPQAAQQKVCSNRIISIPTSPGAYASKVRGAAEASLRPTNP